MEKKWKDVIIECLSCFSISTSFVTVFLGDCFAESPFSIIMWFHLTEELLKRNVPWMNKRIRWPLNKSSSKGKTESVKAKFHRYTKLHVLGKWKMLWKQYDFIKYKLSLSSAYRFITTYLFFNTIKNVLMCSSKYTSTGYSYEEYENMYKTKTL